MRRHGSSVAVRGHIGYVAEDRISPIRRIFGVCIRGFLLGQVTLLLVSHVVAQRTVKNVPGKLLIASDIHFNPMADPALVADLAAADPTQWETILQRSKLTKFSPYGQDSNWWLMQSSLDAMARTEPHPALIMFTGDLLAHNFPKTYMSITHDSDPEHYRAFVLKTFEFVALEFRKRFADVKILLTPGNNDEDCGDYSIEAKGAFLDDTAGRAQELAREGEPFKTTWKALGSYSLEHPTLRNVRIVSLNTVFWSNKYKAASFANGCAVFNSTAAGDLFNWLDSQLAEAEQAHEKVWLMFHIAPGIDGWASSHPASGNGTPAKSCSSSIVPMWVPEWTARFEALLGRYQNTVLASFAGHIHVDTFMLIGSHGANKQFVLINPPVSPIYSQNPSFRIVNFGSDGSLHDQSTFYLTNLSQAGGETRGRWKREYTYSRQWKMRHLDGASLAREYDEIVSRKKARDLWLKLYMVSSTASPIPPDDVRALYCAIGALDQQSYEACYCAPPGSAPKAPGKDPK